ncbi:MAG: glycosyltransferase family 4 protein [Elusimicrobiota bacterium]|nr:glycosyltransferase family 4 protein [Endomicrobiia bacterium]MDW8166365.1 glycosyltransferase family 4 protein [Elusimicrobiota bacterium]
MNKKIKVVHIITKLELGGAQRNTLYTVENISKENFDVYLISGCGGILDSEAIKLSRRNVKVVFLKNLIREINPIKDFLSFLNIYNFLKEINPDIVHTHSSKAGIVGRWAAFFLNFFKKRKIKIIHTFHGFSFSKFHNFFVRNLYIFLEYLTGKISDILIFVSKENMNTAKNLRIGSYKKYVLIRSGIKIKEFYRVSENDGLKIIKKRELNLPLDYRIITTIGPFKPQKNLVDFIRMVKIVTNSLPTYKLKFLIVGDGEQRQFLIDFSKKLKVSEKIYFLSWHKDIKGIMCITDIFVLTSLWEGLPRSAVEALVSGVPVVSYAVDGLKDIIVSDVNGFIVEPKNVEELSKKIILLLTDNKIFSKIKGLTWQTIDYSFDIDYMVKQQEDLYSRLFS